LPEGCSFPLMILLREGYKKEFNNIECLNKGIVEDWIGWEH
jgi:hypothetical protein